MLLIPLVDVVFETVYSAKVGDGHRVAVLAYQAKQIVLPFFEHLLQERVISMLFRVGASPCMKLPIFGP